MRNERDRHRAAVSVSAGISINHPRSLVVSNGVLRKIRLPNSLCPFRSNTNCKGLTHYRTVTGVCNHPRNPYQGSSQTAFGRLLPAAYDDGTSMTTKHPCISSALLGLSRPRSQSVLGGPLPGCRQISLALGSKPVFDTSINNLWVIYGQFLVHDLTQATPVVDSGRTPITSCSCDSTDTDMCNVINIEANDPFMSGQKCMALPATAQAFAGQVCALGAKEQMNANSHYIDLSVTYGSTRETALNLRTGLDGLMKITQKPGSKFDLPPGQRDGRSCTDSTETNKCFAGGDSRLMENLVLSGVQAQWLRMHNIFARQLSKLRPDWRSNDILLYEEAKKILSGVHQFYSYELWLPVLIGKQATQQYVGDQKLFTSYDSTVCIESDGHALSLSRMSLVQMPGVVFNEAVTAVLRLHTFVRDLVTRCKPNGQLIDQLWLHDITSKCKFAYE